MGKLSAEFCAYAGKKPEDSPTMSKDSEDSGRLQVRTLTSVVDLNASILREITALLDELTPEYDKLEVVSASAWP